MKATESFNFRLLNMKDDFYKYINDNNLDRSDVLRHFIKLGISDKSGFSLAEQTELKAQIIDMTRIHRGIGNNINQIARTANQQGVIFESTLTGSLNETLENQKNITILLTTLLSKL